MTQNASRKIRVTKVFSDAYVDKTDALAIEEPLEIRLQFGMHDQRATKNVSVTMRTPGNDIELAAGFLFTEGIVKFADDIAGIDHCFVACSENKENIVQVSLKEWVVPNLQNTERNFYTTSSCGVCGKGSINAIRTVSSFSNADDHFTISSGMLYGLPAVLEQQQAVFADTGGLHASALFSPEGELIMVKEDVGRHNALDKLIGAALLSGRLPLNRSILLLSGRASFELVQKAAMAGICIIASVGAPSSLAVELAEEFNITLAGFLRGNRFNIYTATHRILLPIHENTH